MEVIAMNRLFSDESHCSRG